MGVVLSGSLARKLTTLLFINLMIELTSTISFSSIFGGGGVELCWFIPYYKTCQVLISIYWFTFQIVQSELNILSSREKIGPHVDMLISSFCMDMGHVSCPFEL